LVQMAICFIAVGSLWLWDYIGMYQAIQNGMTRLTL